MIRISDFKARWEHLRDRKIYVACSGGVDSMALLHLLMHTGARLSVLHINYRLRGEASDLDEALVRESCERLEIPYEVRHYDTRQLLKEQGGNLQDMARRLRRDWFAEILAGEPSALIALGHQLDDQVETFFQHIARKSGIRGMAGMLETNGSMIRPLLGFYRQEVLEFAQNNQVRWREDASNLESHYTRNKLRNIILPELEEAIPGLKASAVILADAFRQTWLELVGRVASLVGEIRRTGNWPLDDFDSRSSEEKAEILRSLSIRQPLIAEMERIRFAQKGRRLLADGAIITRETNAFHFHFPQQAMLHRLLVEKVDALPSVFDTGTLYLDEEKISGKLVLRPWKTGDRMQPAGMQGSKLISDILKDARVPAHQKAQALVLADDRNILWCVGVRVSAIAIADEGTRSILRISLKQI